MNKKVFCETGTIKNSPNAAAHKIATGTRLLACVCKYYFVYMFSILEKVFTPPPTLNSKNLIFLLND